MMPDAMNCTIRYLGWKLQELEAAALEMELERAKYVCNPPHCGCHLAHSGCNPPIQAATCLEPGPFWLPPGPFELPSGPF